jgi:glycosyltransferase involved in cell wall biosynthesis
MKILIIESVLDYRLSGGGIYNSLLLSEVLRNKNVDSLTDDIVGNYRISLFYNIIYLVNLKRITKYDMILTDSSNYPRLVFFLVFLKIIKRNCSIVTTHHHFAFFTKKNKLIMFISKILEISFLKLCTEVIIPSQFTLEVSEKFLNKNRLTFIPLGFDTSIKLKQNEKNKSDVFNLLFVGSIYYRKGLIYLIEALSKIKSNFILNIIGSYRINDKYYGKLLSKIKNFGLEGQIKIHGRVSDIELDMFFRSADAFVFPSLYEGYGMVIAEAFTYGLPVVAFNNSAMPYIVINGYNGFLVENKSILELKEVLDRLSENIHLREQLSRNALKTASELNKYENMISEMKKWVTKTIK